MILNPELDQESIKHFCTHNSFIMYIAICRVKVSTFRHGSDITLDVTAKLLDKSGMGLVTSPDGDSHIILNSKSLSPRRH